MKKFVSLATESFNFRKRLGKIEKIGKCRFHNGNRECERVLYRDNETDIKYVFLNGNVHQWIAYTQQPYEYLIGHIH